jgi:hypothetical protein
MTLKGEILFDESISGGNIFTWNSSIANGLFIYNIVGEKTLFSGKIVKF